MYFFGVFFFHKKEVSKRMTIADNVLRCQTCKYTDTHTQIQGVQKYVIFFGRIYPIPISRV